MWSEEGEEQPIALVEERQPLYNTTLQCYSSLEGKDQLWPEIARKLRVPGGASYFCTTSNP